MAAPLESRTDKRPGQQQMHGEERQLRKRKWQGDECVLDEMATENTLEDIAFFNTQEEHKRSLLWSARTALQDQGLRLKRALLLSLRSSANLMLPGGTWRPLFAPAVFLHHLTTSCHILVLIPSHERIVNLESFFSCIATVILADAVFIFPL